MLYWKNTTNNQTFSTQAPSEGTDEFESEQKYFLFITSSLHVFSKKKKILFCKKYSMLSKIVWLKS